MERLILLLFAVLLTACGGLRQTVRDVSVAPSGVAAMAILARNTFETREPPTFDEYQDSVYLCKDEYEGNRDILAAFGDRMDCLCFQDYKRLVVALDPNLGPNPLFEEYFCSVPDEPPTFR